MSGTGRLTGKVAVITGGDSGIGRAVAIAYAREGADVVICYLSEHDDAKDTARLVERAGRKAVLVAGDVSRPEHCRQIIERAVDEFGKIDILVSNAAYQMSHESLEEISRRGVGVHLRHQHFGDVLPGQGGPAAHGPGLVDHRQFLGQLRHAVPQLAPYAATKAAIANFAASLAGLLGERGIRVNSVAPGPIWTPLIPATMPRGEGEELRQGHPAGPGGTARRAGPGVCPAGLRRGQLHFRRPDRRHRRPADPVKRSRSDSDRWCTRRLTARNTATNS